MIIHADFQGEGTLKVIKRVDCFEFTNPGILKIPKELIYKGGNSKARNPRMQTMLRMIGYGDTAGSGFPTILAAWAEKNWPEPELEEDTILNQVTLTLRLGSNNGSGSNLNDTEETTKETTKKITKITTREKVLELLRDNPQASAKELAEEIGITADGVRYHLDKLKKGGLIYRDGPDKGGRWIVVKK